MPVIFITNSKPEKQDICIQMMHWIKNNKLLVAGILLGSIAGFLYWKLVGCSSGTCMITSKWHNSTAYGALMGGLLLTAFKKEKKEKTDE
jgi:hypothetical protein